MSSNIVGLILIVYGVYTYVSNSGVDKNVNFLLGSVGVAIFGVAYIIYNNLDKIKSFVPKFDAKPVDNRIVQSEKCFKPSDFNIRDTEALYHLKQRCVTAGSKEGIETCSRLADIIFNLDLPRKTEGKNNE